MRGMGGLWRACAAPRRGAAVGALACAARAGGGSSGGERARAALERGTRALLARRAEDGGLDEPGEPLARRVYANALLVLALPRGPERDALREWLARAHIRDVEAADPRP